ncbi:efflux RND transporter periplasmic adaptor subunit [Polyangium mundeleinium]|uniref:Efflux RND transporter periplasmic adaptor subunit n=1 Tax=Polyangium mundeleinium TaxID=2995306 RepID=A0ABT5EW03_9BACT|nr:efflux RND transporter periplasmic adaptor subunit [Polyangium mundeleinium]MDC0745997.1 efflux RND transporter periplasmic adaptor subunit [Polyangium mundeleinium]
MRHLRLPFLCAALLAACASAETSTPPPPPPPPEVSVVSVAPHAVVIEDVLPGRVAPVRVADVRPLVSGIVLERLFNEGDTVKAGQALYRIDPTVFRAEVASAAATTERQRAALAIAKREAERAQILETGGAIAGQAADNARSTMDIARADLAIAEASLARSRVSLRYATVTAPISGRIGLSRVTEGALVGTADPVSMVTIQQLDHVYVDIRQPVMRYEELRKRLARGELETSQGLPVTLLSMRGDPYAEQGRLLSTDVNVDPSTSELTLRVLVENKELHLLPGMFVRARIPVGREPQAITVPQQAVLHDPALGESVLVVDPSDRVVARSVTTGRIVEGQQIVRDGLASGDRVVVEGQDQLKPGMSVRPSTWKPPPNRPSAPSEAPAATAAPSASAPQP